MDQATLLHCALALAALYSSQTTAARRTGPAPRAGAVWVRMAASYHPAPFFMTIDRRHLLHSLAGFAAATVLPAGWTSAHAAPTHWPSKPLRFIVGYPAGSSPDMQARMIAQPLAQILGQPVVVDNRPGASGNIGADQVARATDDHSFGIVGNGPLTSSQALYAKLPYDPVKDFAPLALVGVSPLAWVVPASAGAQTDKALASLRQKGNAASYGSTGLGSGGHLGMELLKDALHFDAVHIPFTGAPGVVSALMGGQLDCALLPISSVLPLVQSGKLAALAVTSAQRTQLMPQTPSMREIGAQDVNIEVWNALMAPASMPAAIRTPLSDALLKVLNSADIRDQLLRQAWTLDDASPTALQTRISSDRKMYNALIAKKKLQLE